MISLSTRWFHVLVSGRTLASQYISTAFLKRHIMDKKAILYGSLILMVKIYSRLPEKSPSCTTKQNIMISTTLCETLKP
jgi:hypothetical protein